VTDGRSHADEAPRCESLHIGADVFRAADQQRTARRTASGALQRPRRSSGSRNFIGWWADHEVPLIRDDATGWEPIEDQAAPRAAPIEKVRQPVAHAVVVGAAKAPHTVRLCHFAAAFAGRRSWWASEASIVLSASIISLR
jgi:hypothetical protein